MVTALPTQTHKTNANNSAPMTDQTNVVSENDARKATKSGMPIVSMEKDDAAAIPVGQGSVLSSFLPLFCKAVMKTNALMERIGSVSAIERRTNTTAPHFSISVGEKFQIASIPGQIAPDMNKSENMSSAPDTFLTSSMYPIAMDVSDT
jgi:hypothetical protein